MMTRTTRPNPLSDVGTCMIPWALIGIAMVVDRSLAMEAFQVEDLN